jgi:hypothetical protein
VPIRGPKGFRESADCGGSCASDNTNESSRSRQGGSDATVDPDTALRWLLEDDQPSVRERVLTDLLDRPRDDPEVVAARAAIPTIGFAREILDARGPEGHWESTERHYRPKYGGLNWRMIALADLGVTRSVPEVAEAAQWWMERSHQADGGFGMDGEGSRGHLCTTGNSVRALLKLGYGDDRRVRSALDWLVRAAAPKGGWSCMGSGRNLDSWEPLSAFAALPRDRWDDGVREVVGKGAEFFLERQLYQQGDPYEPWWRTHAPAHYYYDVLVGLDVLTDLGYAADPRLDVALNWLVSRRRPDGRWVLDAMQPDLVGSLAEWFAAHPKDRPTPWSLEPVGAPSKIVTLAARRVLRRVERARGGPFKASRWSGPPETPRAASPGSTAVRPTADPRPGPTSRSSRARRTRR